VSVSAGSAGSTGSTGSTWIPKAAFGFIALVGLCFVALGAFFIDVGLEEWRLGEASRSWPTVEGRVLASEVATRATGSRGSGGPSTTTTHEIRYEYEIDGVRREGRRVAYTVAMGEGDLRARAARYPAGRAVEVHVDPEDPDRAVLEPGADGWNALPIAMGGLAIAFPLAVVAFAWRLCRRFGVL
jgi:hypothetical protein